MRGYSESRGRLTRLGFCKEDGTFFTEEETHPFLLRLAEAHTLSGTPFPVPLPMKPDDCPEKGKRR